MHELDICYTIGYTKYTIFFLEGQSHLGVFNGVIKRAN